MNKSLPFIKPKSHHNYIAFFLTFACNLKCPYCINYHDGVSPKKRNKYLLSINQWIDAANRLLLRYDLPLTLQGGEPTLYKGFYRFVNEVKPEIKMDLMTNLMFDVNEFIREVPVWRFTRSAPYAAIRVSYHPGQNNIDEIIQKIFKLQDAGFRIGVYGIEHPDKDIYSHIKEVQNRCLKLGIDFRTKEFLGDYDGITYGTYKYDGCVSNNILRKCLCRTSEIIVDPLGNVYKCHSDLYHRRSPIAHVLECSFSEDTIDVFRECDSFGNCNPCDVKVKTNRFQVFGHTSVEIRDISH